MDYSLAAFATRSSDDIIFLSAGPIVGTGYFDNVGRTRRAGIEASLAGTARPAIVVPLLCAGRRHFRERAGDPGTRTIQAANDDGEIAVRPGDRIPAIPKHSLKAGVDFAITDRLTLGGELVASSKRYLRGDEANLQAPIKGFAIVNATAGYRLGRFELFGRIENLLDDGYETLRPLRRCKRARL